MPTGGDPVPSVPDPIPDDDAVQPFGSVGVSASDPSVLVLRGEVDVAVAGEVMADIPAWAQVTTVDMSEATFVDSSGMRLLVQVARLVAPRRLRLEGISAGVHRSLLVLGADALLDLVPATPAADADASRGRARSTG